LPVYEGIDTTRVDYLPPTKTNGNSAQ